MIQKKIVDHHGRVENVKLFSVDPTPFIQEAKQKEEDRIKAEKEEEKKKQLAKENGEEIEEVKEDPAAAAQVADEEPAEPDYVSYDQPSMRIFDIFGEYGKETKAEVDEEPECQKKLYYDFTPFNSKDPVLLSLMTAKKYY